MKRTHFDYIVIGGGSGGYAAARTAREVLEHVAIIDSSKVLGGLCILRGCMPSKTLLYSAEMLHLARRGKEFGLHIPETSVNMKLLHQRKLEVIKEFSEYRKEQLESERFTLFRSHARFIDKQTIELSDGKRLSADYFMVATGSTVSTPPIKGLNNIPFWTSDEILELNFLPEKVIVLGGGIVACELAQLLRRLGSEVVQIQRSSHILKETPIAASSNIEKCFRNEGIEIYTDTLIRDIAFKDSSYYVTFTQGDNFNRVNAPHLLNALGRKAATEGLGLEKAGVEVKDNGKIICSAMQQTSNPLIYACGDVTGPHDVVHLAILQGELAARHATGRVANPVDYDHLLNVVFTDPQIATVGLGEKQLKERGVDYLSAYYPFNDHGKSILMEAKNGYVKVFADRISGIILGSECISKDAGELIHSMAVAVTMKARVKELLKVHWYHPTLSEIWSYPLEDIVKQME